MGKSMSSSPSLEEKVTSGPLDPIVGGACVGPDKSSKSTSFCTLATDLGSDLYSFESSSRVSVIVLTLAAGFVRVSSVLEAEKL